MGAFSVPLQVQTPQPRSPLTSIGALMQLRGQMSELALNQARTEQAKQQTEQIAAETAQKQRDVSDQNQIQQIEKDPGAFGKILSGDLSPLAGKISDKTLQTVRTNVNAALQNEAVRTTEQLKQRGDAANAIGTNLGTALMTQRKPDGSLDVDKVNALLPGFIQSHAAELKALGVDPSTVPTSITDEDHLNLLASRINGFSAMNKAALEMKQGQAAASEAQAKADIEQFKANALKGGAATPEGIAAGVRAMSVFQGHPQEMQDAIDAANAAFSAARGSNDPLSAADKAQEAVKGIADRLRASSPGVIAGKVSEARAMIPEKVDEQAALIPGEVKRASQTAYATIAPHIAQAVQEQAALAKNAPGAFSGIIEPTARRAAESQYDTATSNYVNAASTAQDLKNLISAAQGGNKAAAAMVPLSEIRSFVNRVNATELRQSAGAGSLLDNIQGKIGKLADGQPIPPEILNQTKQLADMQIQNASRKYDAGIAALTQKGANPKRVALPGTVEVKAGGITHVFTSDAEASAFEKLVKDHGGTSSRE